jgi:hypothetical protein
MRPPGGSGERVLTGCRPRLCSLETAMEACHYTVAACTRVVNTIVRPTSRIAISNSLSIICIVGTPYDIFSFECMLK